LTPAALITAITRVILTGAPVLLSGFAKVTVTVIEQTFGQSVAAICAVLK
jgi:hypothetical protein